jgi:hypothetical protein
MNAQRGSVDDSEARRAGKVPLLRRLEEVVAAEDPIDIGGTSSGAEQQGPEAGGR